MLKMNDLKGILSKINFNCLSLTKGILLLLVIELVLGGGGRYIVFFDILSFRMLLIGLSFSLWLFCLYKKKFSLSNIRKEILFFSLFMGLIVPLVGSFIGIINGNGFGNIFADANGYIFYLYIIVFASVFNTKKDVKNLFILFMGSIFIWGVFSFLIFILNNINVLNVRSFRYVLINYGYGGVVGIMPNGVFRFFTEGSLYLQLGLAFIWGKYLLKEKMTLIEIITFFVLTFFFLLVITLTYTRGFWLAVIAEIIAFIIIIKLRSKLLFIGGLILLFFISNIVSAKFFDFSLKDYYVNRLLSSIPANLDLDESSNIYYEKEETVEEATSSSVKEESLIDNNIKEIALSKTGEADNRDEDIKEADPFSAQYRVEMYKVLIQKIRKSPIIGYGFGKNFTELEGEYSYELSYLDMMTKFGVPAFFVWIIMISYFLFLTLFKWYKRRTSQYSQFMISFAVGIGSILITGFFNPFLVSSTGILSIVLFLVYCNFRSEEVDNNFKIY